MPFTHHSHSGQFCGHATNTLEEVIQDAIAKGMTTVCTTEHIPRDRIDFYEEEIDTHTPETLRKLFDDYYHEARRLQKAYKDEIEIFVGFESEWIRDSTFKIMEELLREYEFDIFVGSVHHVYTVPIDMDFDRYRRARDLSGGEDAKLFEDYYEAQFSMLKALRPPVVGHFDLIRLRSPEPDKNSRYWSTACWEKIERNLKFVKDYGGVLELNTSSLRKGLREAYPHIEICKKFRAIGGRFTLSDDSHGVSQVALNYSKVLEIVKEARITELCYLTSISDTVKPHDPRFPKIGWKTISVEELEKHAFWTK